MKVVYERNLNVMATFKEKVEEILECPVCFNIPREFPVPSCRAGHIVCRPCRKNMSTCPTCRHNLSHTNTMVGYMAQICSHKCSFTVFGCDHITNIDEIGRHEEECQERTIQCPFKDCSRDIQLKNFEDHTRDQECAIDLNRVEDYDFFAGLSVHYSFLKLFSFYSYRLNYITHSVNIKLYPKLSLQNSMHQLSLVSKLNCLFSIFP